MAKNDKVESVKKELPLVALGMYRDDKTNMYKLVTIRYNLENEVQFVSTKDLHVDRHIARDMYKVEVFQNEIIK